MAIMKKSGFFYLGVAALPPVATLCFGIFDKGKKRQKHLAQREKACQRASTSPHKDKGRAG
jgi:hypothetical protein